MAFGKFCTRCNTGRYIVSRFVCTAGTRDIFKYYCTQCNKEDHVTEAKRCITCKVEKSVIDYLHATEPECDDCKKATFYKVIQQRIRTCIYCGVRITSSNTTGFCMACAINMYHPNTGALKPMAYVYLAKTYNDTIIKIRFQGAAGRRDDWNKVVTPALEFLKASVPVSHREYDPATKTWSIGANYFPAFELYIKAHRDIQIIWHFAQSTTTNEPKVNVPKDYAENFFHNDTPAVPNKLDSSIIRLKLGQLLGITITTQGINELKPLYRKAALQLHPDRNNGDGTMMSELNMLWMEFGK